MKKLLLFILISTNLFSYSIENIRTDIDELFEIVPQYEKIIINGKERKVDMKRLLNMTAMIESSYGRDNYEGRIAKTYMQIELNTSNHYVEIMPQLRSELEFKLNRRLVVRDSDAIYIAYIIYLSKFKYHAQWLNKLTRYKNGNDVEWYVYKIFYNSIDGKSKYSKWKQRVEEFKHLSFGFEYYTKKWYNVKTFNSFSVRFTIDKYNQKRR